MAAHIRGVEASYADTYRNILSVEAAKMIVKGRQAESATGRRTTTRVDLEVAAFLQRGKRQETGCSLLVQYVDGRGHAYVCDFSEMGSMTCDQSLLMPKAAVNYQQNVLNAWQKIDDALSACAAEQHQAQHLQAHVRNVYQLA